jgi:hypothetical protein
MNYLKSFFLMALEFELSACFTLARQALYCLSHSASIFCAEFFKIEFQELFASSGLEPKDPPDLCLLSS